MRYRYRAYHRGTEVCKDASCPYVSNVKKDPVSLLEDAGDSGRFCTAKSKVLFHSLLKLLVKQNQFSCRRQENWCGEGDLNPQSLTANSPSNYRVCHFTIPAKLLQNPIISASAFSDKLDQLCIYQLGNFFEHCLARNTKHFS